MSTYHKQRLFVEAHAIQSFAVSCLNRDEGNVPKSTLFGGVRRSRVSSQSWKYAMRHHALFPEITGQEISKQTQYLIRELSSRLVQFSPKQVEPITKAFVEKYLGPVKQDKNGVLISKVMVRLHSEEIDEMANALANKDWEILYAEVTRAEAEKQKKSKGKAAKGAQDSNEASDDSVISGADDASETQNDNSVLGKLATHFKDNYRTAIAADQALFGRMLAEGITAKRVDGVCQVAHAISTHFAPPQDDFFVAMDDLKRDDDVGGSGHMGNLDFATPCLYRYAGINLVELQENLKTKPDLVRGTAEAFLQTFIRAIPQARQNSMASPTMPSFIMLVVRTGGEAWSLVNAFEQPVPSSNEKGFVIPSIQRLDTHWQLMKSGFDYETTTIKKLVYMIKHQEPVDLPNIEASLADPETGSKVDSVNLLVKTALNAAWDELKA